MEVMKMAFTVKLATYEDLKAAIQQVIRTNGNNEITGALLQQTLLSIVNSVGANAAFAGIATPNTNPGTADQNVFYLATEAGTYVNFGGIEIAEGEAVILSNKTGNWTKTTSGFATQQQLTELDQRKSNNHNIFGEEVIFDYALLIAGVEKVNGYLITPYIPVNNGDYVLVTHRISESTSYRIVLYDSELNILDTWGAGTNGRSFTVEFSNAAYLRATMYVASEDEAFVSVNGVKVWNDEFYKKSIKEYIEDIGAELKDSQSLSRDNLCIPALPDYYFYGDYINLKVKSINEEIRKCSNNGDIFYWITDVHWEEDRNARKSPSLINYINQRTNIPRLFNGGDNYDGLFSNLLNPTWTFDGQVDYVNMMKKAIKSNKVYITYGNHEVISHETYADIFYANRQHNDDVIFGDAEKSYFYTENEQQKIRYIILTAFGPSETESFTNEFEHDPEQLDWLRNVALNVDEDWTCLIFIHSIFMITLPSKEIAPRYIADINEYYGEPWSGMVD